MSASRPAERAHVSFHEPLTPCQVCRAVDVVDPVGPGGGLNEIHTAAHFHEELHLSPLFPCRGRDSIQQRRGAFDRSDRAAKIALELWRPPRELVLTDDQLRALNLVAQCVLAS